jgi:long-chain acyl-CoA synthetase
LISSYDFLAFHATERPSGIALIVDGRAITYAEFRRDVAALTGAVREFQLTPGSLVTVGCDDFYAHWLLLLAFERLGIATASLASNEGADCAPLLESSDLVISGSGFPVGTPKRHHALSAAWLDRALAGEEDGGPFWEGTEASPVRLVRTSGTTGEPKRLIFSRRTHDSRAANWAWCSGLTRRSRYLLTQSLKVASAHIHATASIRVGATLVVESRVGAIQALSDHGITHMAFLPGWLRQILQDLPIDFAKPRELFIASFGSALPPALRREALERLATEIIEFYGSNEVGFVFSARGDGEPGVGAIWPGVQVEIVDEDGRILPMGVGGTIRVRTDAMVDGYVGDPGATARMFRDGWFYPGDTGRMPGRDQLEVIARDDDLLNIGGNKVSPLQFEEMILRATDVTDAAVFSAREASGVEELWVAVVGGRTSDAELLTLITRALNRRGTVGRFHVVRLPSIPRTPTGKIQRSLLRQRASEGTQ